MSSSPSSRPRRYTVIGGDAKRKKLKPIAFEKMALIQQELALIEKQLTYLQADENVNTPTTSNVNNNIDSKSITKYNAKEVGTNEKEQEKQDQQEKGADKTVSGETEVKIANSNVTDTNIDKSNINNAVKFPNEEEQQELKLEKFHSPHGMSSLPSTSDLQKSEPRNTAQSLSEEKQKQQKEAALQNTVSSISEGNNINNNNNNNNMNAFVQDDLISPEAAPMLLVELCQLAAAGNEVAVRTLLSAGADPNSRDYDDRTLLHIATMHHHLSIVRALLEYGADYNLVDREGATPLDVARSMHYNDLVEVFCAQMAQEGYAPIDSYADQCISSESASPISQHVPDFSSVPQPMVGSLIVIMMGLPGRGKTYVSQQIRRYFQWNGLPCAIFLHQAYRKKIAKTMTQEWEQQQQQQQQQQQKGKITQWANPMSMPEYAAQHNNTTLPTVITNSPDVNVVNNDIINSNNINNTIKYKNTSVDDMETMRQTMTTEYEMEHLVAAALAEDMTRFLSRAGGVAILDGTQSTPQRRHAVLRAIKKTKRIKSNRVIVVEIVNNNEESIMKNILRAKEMFPNAPDNFVELYRQIMAQHEAVYRTLNPITDGNLSYIRMEEEDTSLNMISGWMPSRLAYMLHNLSHTPVSLYLTRPGEYLDMITGHIGGNSRLTLRGEAYAIALFEYFMKELPYPKEFAVMSSCSKRCTQTLEHFVANSSHHNESIPVDTATADKHENAERDSNKSLSNNNMKNKLNCRVSFFPTLDDLNHGDCEGLRFEDVYKTMPSTLQYIHADPYYTAWPNGECIHQVYNARLEPHIHDIQASSVPMLVVSHLHLLQGLYAYFVTDEDKAVAPQNAYQIDIPYECVIKIHMIGTRRVAEFIDLAKDVNRIMLQRTGDIGGCPRLPPQYNMYKMNWNQVEPHIYS